MKVIQLTAENVKKLRAVNIKPDGTLVIVAGKNGAGKSSLLDSIKYAIGGKGTLPSKPIRNGETRAEVVVDLGDIVVKRTFTENDSYLSVENHDGAAYKSPQKILDALYEGLTFDPEKFSRMKPAEQAEALRALMKIDFSKLDASRQRYYDLRRDVNRDLGAAKSRYAELPDTNGDLPDSPISVSDTMAELDAADRQKRENDALRLKLDRTRGEMDGCLAKIDEIEKRLTAAMADRERIGDELEALSETANALEDPDVNAIRAKLQGAEEINTQIASRKAKASAKEEIESLSKKSGELADKIKAVDAEKERVLAVANFPIAGLSFTGDGVSFNGVPLDQAASSERLRVSAAIGIAMNPELKVLLFRDGSLLDDEGLAMVAAMAEKSGHQIWVERVGSDENASVIIEDGTATGAAATN